MKKIVCWFSCGAASAVATKIILDGCADDYEIVVARCVIPNEHEDNRRFSDDCAAWFGQPIINLRSPKYHDAWDVWEKVRLLKNQHGAPCTKWLKIYVRHDFELLFEPDFQVFGYTADEKNRAVRFQRNNLRIKLLNPLIDNGVTKSDCFQIVQDAGIKLPVMYELGFDNNNCIGCVKGGKNYWRNVRKHFPIVFNRMANLERKLNYALLRDKEAPLFLDSLSE